MWKIELCARVKFANKASEQKRIFVLFPFILICKIANSRNIISFSSSWLKYLGVLINSQFKINQFAIYFYKSLFLSVVFYLFWTLKGNYLVNTASVIISKALPLLTSSPPPLWYAAVVRRIIWEKPHKASALYAYMLNSHSKR